MSQFTRITYIDGLVSNSIRGWATSALLAKALIPRVSKSLSRLPKGAVDDDVASAISGTFEKLDDEIIEQSFKNVQDAEPADPDVITEMAAGISGSCALLSVYEPESSVLRSACVGDSRAVLGTLVTAEEAPKDSGEAIPRYKAKALTVDQNAQNEIENARVKAEHPGEEDDLFDGVGRFVGIMVTRAFGDHRWKCDDNLVKKTYNDLLGHALKPNLKTPPYLTAKPVITTTTVETKDFVIIASDGMWDHMTSEDAVLCVEQWMNKKKGNNQREQRGQNAGHDVGSSGIPKDSMPHVVEYLDGYPVWYSRPEHFVVEDMDNAAVHLLKNVLGGKRRKLFTSATLMYNPLARQTRDDITVQVIFFDDSILEE